MAINIGVFFGGISVEHRVSVVSALQAVDALDKTKYNAVPIYISKEGDLYTGDILLDVKNFKDMSVIYKNAVKISIVKSGDKAALIKYPMSKFKSNEICCIDAAMPVVHGTNCEDGTLQGYIKMLGIPYTGCDVLSSALGMDKVAMKYILAANGIPTAKGVSFTNREWFKEKEKFIAKCAEIGFPLIVKPANLGSSVGVSKASDETELIRGIEQVFELSGKVLVEECIFPLREINCSVLGDCNSAKASVCEEPVTESDFLDYDDKYKQNAAKGMSSAKRVIPADLPEEVSEKIRNLAVETFKKLGCGGVARVDLMMNAETNEIYVNEINTIPGSLSFYLWEKSGYTFSQLLDEMINLAFKRKRSEDELVFTYENNILSGDAFKNGLKGLKGKMKV